LIIAELMYYLYLEPCIVYRIMRMITKCDGGNGNKILLVGI